MTANQLFALGFFAGAVLMLLACLAFAFFVAQWFESLNRIVVCIEKRDARREEMDARREETDREVVATLRVISRNQELLASEMTLLKGATRSLVGNTERLMQRIERWEAQQRGEVVPELEQRQYRTVEENDAIASRGE
jgi:flagellar biosynthesis component FlhA